MASKLEEVSLARVQSLEGVSQALANHLELNRQADIQFNKALAMLEDVKALSQQFQQLHQEEQQKQQTMLPTE